MWTIIGWMLLVLLVLITIFKIIFLIQDLWTRFVYLDWDTSYSPYFCRPDSEYFLNESIKKILIRFSISNRTDINTFPKMSIFLICLLFIRYRYHVLREYCRQNRPLVIVGILCTIIAIGLIMQMVAQLMLIYNSK